MEGNAEIKYLVLLRSLIGLKWQKAKLKKAEQNILTGILIPVD